jgi:hypothetical protein
MVIRKARQGMDKDKVAKRDGKARSAFNLSEQHTFIHPEYHIVLDGKQIGLTGLFVIARLELGNATIGTLPEFILRWDEKGNHLNVDPVGVSKAMKRRFEKGTDNYYGHHSEQSRSGTNVLEVNIGWDGQPIYNGKIRFSLKREAEITAGVRLSTSISVKFRKGNG